MKLQFDERDTVLTIFLSLIAFLLFGILIFVSRSIISPIFVYILILFYFLLNRNQKIISKIFYLSTLVFALWFINELFYILIPFLLSFLFAYTLNPITNFLERKKIKRWLASLISIFILTSFAGIILTIILPPFSEQIGLLISSAPESLLRLQDFFNQSILPELERFGVLYPEFQKFIADELPLKVQELVNGLLNSFLSIINSLGSIFNQIINLVVIPIITFYILKDFNKIIETILDLFTDNVKSRLKDLGTRVDQIFGNYIRGFLIIALINGIVITAGLTLLNVKYAIVLGLISAVLSVIPYFGVIIGFATGFIISLLSGVSGWKLLLIPILYFGENLIESSVYIPKIIGGKLGLHPLVILLSIFVFGYFGGFVGMLIAVPVTALIISLIIKKDNHQID